MKIVIAVGVLVLGGLAGCGGDATDRVAAVNHPAAPVAMTHEGALVTAQASTASSPLVREVQRWRHVARFRQPDALPECGGAGSPHFDTPEAAMRNLATAWNADDYDALCAVTNPNARMMLLNMHREATNLRLSRCRPSYDGMYSCTFRHDFPARMNRGDAVGHARLDVAPARGPGWYMTVFVGCGG